MAVGEVRAQWLEVESLLDDSTRRALRKPATPARLAALAKAIGKVPLPLRALLECHDGMRGLPLYLNVRLLGASELATTVRMRIETSEDVPYVWSRDWLPFTDGDGDHVCIDRKSGRILDFRNAGAKARVIAPSLVAWLDRVPRLIREERRSDEKRASLLPKPAEQLPKKDRERIAKIDREHEHLIRFVAGLQKDWKTQPEWQGLAPAHRVLDYRGSARVKARDVVERAVELGYLERVGEGYRTTAKGRRFADA